jgi:hypothetical protein
VIALDSSILVGIIRGERDVQQLLPVLDGEACAIDAPTLVEAALVLGQPDETCVRLAGASYRGRAGHDRSVRLTDVMAHPASIRI